MKVLFTVKQNENDLQKIKDLGYDVLYIPENKIYNTEQTDDADVLVTYNPFNSLDISKMKNLKYIMLTSVGFDQLPMEKVLNQGIMVTNNKGGYSIPIAEWIVMCILEIYKNSKVFYKNQSEKIWHLDYHLDEIDGKTIGFLGTGTIASEAAKRLIPFGVRVLGYNTNGRDVEFFNKCYAKDQMDEIFKNSDVVVATMPCTKETEKIIDKSKFDLMKDNSIFINVGRGKIVNQKDLENSLDKFKGVALDVFESEPLDKDSILWSAENVKVTSHNSWVSVKNKIRTSNLIYSNLEKYINKETVKNIVNIKRGY